MYLYVQSRAQRQGRAAYSHPCSTHIHTSTHNYYHTSIRRLLCCSCRVVCCVVLVVCLCVRPVSLLTLAYAPHFGAGHGAYVGNPGFGMHCHLLDSVNPGFIWQAPLVNHVNPLDSRTGIHKMGQQESRIGFIFLCCSDFPRRARRPGREARCR